MSFVVTSRLRLRVLDVVVFGVDVAVFATSRFLDVVAFGVDVFVLVTSGLRLVPDVVVFGVVSA